MEVVDDADEWAPRQGVAQEVHIVPLGLEYDRAVLPFFPRGDQPPFFHAHRIHLLGVQTEPAREFLVKVEAALQPVADIRRHLIPRVDPRSGRLVEFDHVLGLVSRICARELSGGHRVHINLSTGPKLVTLAAGLAGMAYLRPGRGSTYYVMALDHARTEEQIEAHGLQTGMVDLQEVQLAPLLLPHPLKLRVLAFLHHRPGHTAAYRELLEFLTQVPGSGHRVQPAAPMRLRRDRANAATTRMVRTLLTPLARQGLVEVTDQGRERAVRLTPDGRLYALLSAIAQDGLRTPLGG